MVPDAKVFRNGRQCGAWLGLTRGQHSSGDRTRRGHITCAAASIRARCWFRAPEIRWSRRCVPTPRIPAACNGGSGSSMNATAITKR
ncbi:transposase [Paraburkholderia sp. 40]|uniref:transposase n=1 Tax=Paraburkholderia sp. 40 TaxID=2991059 RepID=UPI003D1E3742